MIVEKHEREMARWASTVKMSQGKWGQRGKWGRLKTHPSWLFT